MYNLLIVEDEKNIRKLMEIRLKEAKFVVHTASCAVDALDILYKYPIDLLVVDIMMPGMNGYEFVKEARKFNEDIPAIMVTAKNSIEDITQGYNIGIDDYMIKPVNYDELILRINAVLRRAKIVKERKLVINDIVLDYNTLTISRENSIKITMPLKEFSILFKLLSYPEQVFTKSELFEEFWDLNSNTDESSIKVHINNIRNKIKDFPEISIENVRGFGYKGVKNEKI